MKNVTQGWYARPLILYLIIALTALSTFAGPAEAMLVPADVDLHHDGLSVSGDRDTDLSNIQTALESSMVRQRLTDYGLSPEEAMARVKTLSDEQIHQLAAHAEALQAGGDAVGFLFSAVVLALLIVLLIFLVQDRIVIR